MLPDNLIVAALGLAIAGIGYNALIDRLQRSGALDGYTAFAVAAGELAVLAAAAYVYGLAIAGGLLLLQATAGAPMILGSMARHAESSRRARTLAARFLQDAQED